MLRFRAFDSEASITKNHGALPHWSQQEAVHFITFRLHDSLPADVMEKWHRSRKEWLALRGETPESEGWFERLPADHRREYTRRFGRVMEEDMDRGLGSCVLRKFGNSVIIAEALEFFDGDRYELGDFVVMPNHVHLLVIPCHGHAIGDILRSWKSFTARRINEQEGLKGPFWQRESFDHIVRNRRQLDRLRAYIAENPAKARLAEGEYLLRTAEWEP